MKSRKSIEERLKESMEKKAAGDPAPERASNPAPAKQPKPSWGAGAKPKTPPKSELFVPGQPRLKPIGQRSPDETGMLEMLPVGTDPVKQAQSDPSATAFFAIPAPKAERGAAPMPAPASSTPVGAALGPPPVVAAVGGPPPPPGAAHRPAPPPPPGGAGAMFSGPVAGSTPGAAAPVPAPPTPGQGLSPFQVQGPAPVGNPGERHESKRVYAIVLGAFLMVCVTAVAAFWISTQQQDPVVAEQPVIADATQTENRPAPVQQDTGIEEPVKPPPPVRKTRPVRTVTPTAPAPTAGALTIALKDPSQASQIEVVCPSGYRNRAGLTGGRATLQGVPAEMCTVHFKGGPPGKFSPVGGGQSKTCHIVGTTAVCN